MTGVLIIDKPAGISSFDVVRAVRRSCRARRVGHAGTLDPFATGVLPIAIGQATRLIEYLMAGDKEYVATMRLGVTTDTQDLDGNVLEERPWEHVTCQRVAEAIKGFIGTIWQVPPMFSAIKQNGQPLYRLARRGIEVDRQAREVRIETIELLACDLPNVRLRVSCSKGTYIRTLCHDLGQVLECGAHLVQLRRTRCGHFAEADCLALAELQAMTDAGHQLPLITPAQALSDWPGFEVCGETLQRLRNGVAPSLDELQPVAEAEAGTLVRLLDGDILVAVARCMPGGFGKRPGDFEILKVFPEVSDG
jgi:tRNA pseudouridine55 synthase